MHARRKIPADLGSNPSAPTSYFQLLVLIKDAIRGRFEGQIRLAVSHGQGSRSNFTRIVTSDSFDW